MSFRCPKCGSRCFGSSRIDGVLMRGCHSNDDPNVHLPVACDFQWPESDDHLYGLGPGAAVREIPFTPRDAVEVLKDPPRLAGGNGSQPLDIDALELRARTCQASGAGTFEPSVVLDLIRQLRTAETIIGNGLKDQVAKGLGLSEVTPHSPLVSCVRIDDDSRMTLSMRGGAEVTIGAVFTASEARELAGLLAPRATDPATRDASKRSLMAPSLRLDFEAEACSCDESIALRKRVAELEAATPQPESQYGRARRELATWLFQGHERGQRRTFAMSRVTGEMPLGPHACYLYHDIHREHVAFGYGYTPAEAQLAALKRYREEREANR